MPSPTRSASALPQVLSVLVCVEESSRAQLDTLVQHAQATGLSVTEVFALSGIIVGTIPPHLVPRLRALPGIASVEEEPTFRAL